MTRRRLLGTFVPSAALFVAYLLVQVSSEELICHDKSQLDACMQKLPQLMSNDRGIPNTKQEVDASCSAFKTGMQCIDQYAELCLNARERKLMNENVAGARHTFAYLCDDPLFQSEYLQFASCYRSVSRDWDMCANRFHRMVTNEVAQRQATSDASVVPEKRIARLCCAKESFLHCVQEVSHLKCRTDAAEFLHRIAETLANVRVYSTQCRALKYSDPCSSAAIFGPWRWPPLLASALLLLLSGVAK